LIEVNVHASPTFFVLTSTRPPLSPSSLIRAVLAQLGMLAAAFAGGWAFALLGIPAPWLSGPMIVTAILASLDWVPPLVLPLRDLALLIAGVSMGASVTPESLGALGAYPASLLILIVSIAGMMAASVAVLTGFGRWSLKDAFFASAPGALSTVLMIAVEERADVPKIAIVQLFRLFVLVMVLPPVISALEPAAAIPATAPEALSPAAFALLVAASLLAAQLFETLGIVAPFILGAMVASSALTGPGFVTGRFPAAIAILGFVLIGVFIGQRFRGLDRTMVLRLLPAACLSLLAALSVAALGAGAVSLATEVSFGSSIVAFAPGGLEAMTVLAFALGLDTIYVGVHHIARFLLVGLMVPFAIKFWPALRREGRG
jgi:membrane AbrB-like protein